MFGKNPKKNDLQKHVKRLIDRGIRPEWGKLGSQARQDVTDRIYKSYDAFFKWSKTRKGAKKSPPKFRPFRKYKSFMLKQAGWKLDEENGKIKICGVWHRYNKSRNIQGNIKTVTIKRDQIGDWYICLSCEIENFEPEKIRPATGKSAGFDFGIKTFLKSSDDKNYQSSQFLKSELKQLAKLNRNLSKKKKGSKNRKKARKQLARLHRRIANKRRDAHFQLAANLLDDYDELFFEDLNLAAMQKLWGRKVSDYGFSDFLNILEFKTLEQKKAFEKIDRWYPSTKMCSNCGEIKKEMPLKVRVFKCDCGHEMDRDLNAAKNIMREGTSSRRLDGVSRDLDPASVA